MLETLVGGLATQASVWTSVVVEVLLLGELVVEVLGGVDDHPFELAIELLDRMMLQHLPFVLVEEAQIRGKRASHNGRRKHPSEHPRWPVKGSSDQQANPGR